MWITIHTHLNGTKRKTPRQASYPFQSKQPPIVAAQQTFPSSSKNLFQIFTGITFFVF